MAFLESIGNGTAPTDQFGRVELVGIQVTTDYDTFLQHGLAKINLAEAYSTDNAILSLRNTVVDEFNNRALKKLDGECHALFSTDRQIDGSEKFFDESFCNSTNLPNIPPHRLELKVNMEGFIVQNILPEDGLLNNTPVRILHISRKLLTVQLLPDGKTYVIPRISFKVQTGNKKIRFMRTQFPVRAEYAKTVNRSQGATIQKCDIDFREEPFAHGQLYVALGRVPKRTDLLLFVKEDQISLAGHALIRNVVYQNLLRSIK